MAGIVNMRCISEVDSCVAERFVILALLCAFRSEDDVAKVRMK